MCGIVGVIGDSRAADIVIDGLKRLEYRGYDSAGLAAITTEGLTLAKAKGKIAALEDKLASNPMPASRLAIGHTRWATHGEPTEANAHPHQSGNCAVVHNGIIENYLDLRAEFGAQGVTFVSETDTESLPVSINIEMSSGKNLLDAVLATVNKAEGAFAFAAVVGGDTEQMVVARRGAPLVVGLGNGANYVGSDPMALAAETNTFIFLENDDVALLTPTSIKVFNKDGVEVIRKPRQLDVSSVLAGKAGYRHFMLKEIHEQPTAVGNTIAAYMDETHQNIALPAMPFDWQSVPQLTIVACGTSYHAAMVAKYWIEDLAGIPVIVDIASEFRYRNPPLKKGGAALFISQSGETADTLAALELCKEKEQHIIALVNVPNSSIARAADVVLTTEAGPEIGVASTKAFTTQLTVFMMLAIAMAKATGNANSEQIAELTAALTSLPAKISQALEFEGGIADIARQLIHAKSALFLGRGGLFPIALEGALKLKEISYIHAEGYASGEMKHGPIALIDEDVPVITIAPMNNLFDKTLSNMKEAEARRGKTLLITDDAGQAAAGDNSHRTLITLPDAHSFLQPLLMTLPLQMLAYHVAVEKGTDVDQPRNLAKSVTVE